MTRIVAIFALVLSASVGASSQQQPKVEQREKVSVSDALHNAFSNPSDPSAFAHLKNVLPRVDDYFVVEGDLLMTEKELQIYVDGKSNQNPSPKNKSAELLVNLREDGALDYYKQPDSRTLTYAIDRNSFPLPGQYDTLTKNMPMATSDWEAACKECLVKFVHLKNFDSSSSPEKVNFVVRYNNAHGIYVAASFFPHDPPLRRYLNIDPSYFDPHSFDQVGVLRHELGHVLGYRHEQIQGIAGCSQEGSSWQPLTPYDSKSVMHYLCGGGGSLKLELTELDKAGHRKLYGTSIKASDASTKGRDENNPSLVIRFEGGKVADNVAGVLSVLQKNHSMPIAELSVEWGDTVTSIYKRRLNLPGTPRSIGAVANNLNKRLNNKKITEATLHVGDSIIVPDIVLTTYPFSLTLDSLSPKERSRLKYIESNWKHLETNSETITDTRTRLSFNGYELRITLENDPKAIKDAVSAISEIDSWKRADIFPILELPAKASPPFYSTSASEYLQQYRKAKEVDLGMEASLGELVRLPDAYPCSENPGGLREEIVLIDQPVYRHPDLGSIVDNVIGPVLPSPIQQGSRTIATYPGSFDAKIDHGTHLAGIIGSQKNGFGFVGLAPGVHIESLSWPDLQETPSQLVDKMTKLENGGGYPVFLFASSWDSTYKGARLLRSRLDGIKPLWITAAGESLDGSDGVDIEDSNFSLGPMNLGDKYYLIVVTACEKCYSNAPRLMRFANYSTREFVHVAAPGDDVPSTISGGGYDKGSGTSQASALAAGLAASMIKCWPSFYFRQPERIKFRLQLTSTPNLRDSDFGKLKAGIIDGKAAILDPESNWQLLATDRIEEAYKKFNPTQWCRESLTLYDAITNLRTGAINTDEIRRIVRRDDSWVIFGIRNNLDKERNLDWERRGEISRVGPGTPQPSDLNLPLLKLAEGSYLTLSQIKDVIFSGDLPHGECK